MSSCNDCKKLNDIPACIDSDAFLLLGITFPDFDTETITGLFTNVSTSRSRPFDIDVDGSGEPEIDIAQFFPLTANHVYKIEFIASNGTPANYTITNPDETTETGCCVEFSVIDHLTASDEWEVSTQGCAV